MNGPGTHEVYRYLRLNSKELGVAPNEAREVPWNFGKFILDRNGRVVRFFNPDQKPMEMLQVIE